MSALLLVICVAALGVGSWRAITRASAQQHTEGRLRLVDETLRLLQLEEEQPVTPAHPLPTLAHLPATVDDPDRRPRAGVGQLDGHRLMMTFAPRGDELLVTVTWTRSGGAPWTRPEVALEIDLTRQAMMQLQRDPPQTLRLDPTPAHLLAALLDLDQPGHRPLARAIQEQHQSWSERLTGLDLDADHITLRWTCAHTALFAQIMGAATRPDRLEQQVREGLRLARELARHQRPPGAVLLASYRDTRVASSYRVQALRGLLRLDPESPLADEALVHLVQHPEVMEVWTVHEETPALLDATIIEHVARVCITRTLTSVQLVALFRLIAQYATPAHLQKLSTSDLSKHGISTNLSAQHPPETLRAILALCIGPLRAVDGDSSVLLLSMLSANPGFHAELMTAAQRARIEREALGSVWLHPTRGLSHESEAEISHVDAMIHTLRLLGWTGGNLTLQHLAHTPPEAAHVFRVREAMDRARSRILDRLDTDALHGALALADDPHHGARGRISLTDRAGEIEMLD